ncbi:MAG: hypothetical protein J5691_03075 [Bacilli bacterium]|nr:hypothetical protein [Bacilli bacterium]
MKIFRYSKLGFYVIGAILLFIFREFFVENLRWFIGGLMMLYGSVAILEIALEKVKPIYDGHGFLFNLIEAMLGLVILLLIEEYATVCIIWAVWSIFRESIELREILARKLHTILAIVSFLESIAVIVLSVLLMMSPGEHHALIHSYLLCIELILTASIPILNSFMFKKSDKTLE